MTKNPNWQTKKLGEVCEIVNGSTPLKSNKEFWIKGDFPWFTIDDIRNQGRVIRHTEQKVTKLGLAKLRILPENSVLLCCTASVGEYAVTKIPLTTNQQFNGLVVKNKRELSPLFLFHFCSTLKDRLLNLSGKTTIDFIPISRLKEIVILLPPLVVQKRIVAILNDMVITIAKAKENVEKNLQNSRELFESYLQSVFADPGEGWGKKKLGEVCELTRGHNPPKSKFIKEPKKGYIRFYQIRDGWADDYAVYVPDTPQLHRVTKNDILMVAYRHIGKVFKGVSGAFNVALCKITNVRKDLLNDDFLFYMIPTNIIKGELMKRSERSLIPSMSVEHLKEIEIPLPPLSKQQTIVKKYNALSAETKKLKAIYQQKLADLEELKKSILQKAFNGELLGA